MAIKVDGKTMNAISQMYAQHTALTEFEFRLGEYRDGQFVPGVARAAWESILKYLKQKTPYVKEETSVKIMAGGFREIKGRDGVELQLKRTLQRPVDVDAVGRFSVSEERVVDAIPPSARVVEVRDRFRYSFKFPTYTIDLTHVKNHNRYEVEVEYAPGVFDVKGLFAPIREITTDATSAHSVVSDFEKLFKRKGVNFNNALNMKRAHFGDLGDYIITPKWDGTRMMLFYHRAKTHLLNRTAAFGAPFRYVHDMEHTVLDGEFFEKTGQYIAFDILFAKGEDVRERTRVERTLLLEQLHAEYNLEFELAEIGSGSQLHACFKHYVNDYPDHTLDGVVFAPMASTYYNKQTLKYKPANLLTIDFLVTVDSTGKYPRYLLHVQGNAGPEPFVHMPVVQKVDAAGRKIIGSGNKIVEFKWQGDTFVPHRVRDDKTTANYVAIVEDIWTDINNPITEQEMGRALQHIAAQFAVLDPFEGMWFTPLGPKYVVSAAGSALSLQSSFMYCADPKYQQKKEFEKDHRHAPKTIFDTAAAQKNIRVVDYHSGKLIHDSAAWPQSVVLAYSVGGRFYSVGKMEPVNDVCSAVIRVFDNHPTNHQDVMAHYDTLAHVRQQDSVSENIRKYNNYVKALLISLKVRKGDSVLDIGAGKGGDIGKFCAQHVSHLTAVDISRKSLKEAEHRFAQNAACKNVSARFIEANAYAQPLDAGQHQVVSSQFSFHYAFGSRHDAETAVGNVSAGMRPGGVFIATLPNASEILARLAQYGPDYGNAHYAVSVKTHGHEFGSQYVFTLPDSVEKCPEFLVDTKVLRDLFAGHGVNLELVLPFPEFVDKYRGSFPALHSRMGTPELTPDEYEVVSLYNVLCFRKQG